MESLRQLSSPTAHVIRDGESKHIPAKDVVPGALSFFLLYPLPAY